ncbi:10654_t:CDS:2, partial [Acaulospora colombiana]
HIDLVVANLNLSNDYNRRLVMRLGIRDSFNSPDAPIQKALKSFNENIGYDFSIDIAWIDLWNDLQGKYTDKSTFVPSIADSVITFLKRLEALLDTSQDFQEIFLEKIERMRKAIFVKIHDKSTPTIEIVRGELLTLFLPKNAAPDYRTISSQIGKDIEEAFRDKSKVERPSQGASEDLLKDDFVDISPTRIKPPVKSSSR